MINFIKKHSYLLLIYLIAIVVYNAWIFKGGYFTFGDWPFHYQEFFKEYLRLPQIWETYNSLGNVDLVAVFDIFKFFDSLLFKFFDFNIATKIIYYWPIAFLYPIFSYIFLSSIIKNKVAVIIGSFVLIYNTDALLLSGSFPTLAGSFIFLPIIFYFFKKTLEKQSIDLSIITSLLLFISTMYEPRATYVIFGTLFIYLIYHIFLNKQLSMMSVMRSCFYFFIPLFSTFILNIYWMLPIKETSLLVNNELFSRNLFGNEFLNILYAITLMHPFWTGSKPTVFVIQSIPLYFWAIPVVAFLGLILNRRNKDILFFGFIAILGILFTKQSAIPFSGLYLWLYKYFPGFNAFREASKFYPLIYLGYSVLIAASIDWLWSHWNYNVLQKFSKYLLTLSIAFIFLLNTKPFITGDIGMLFKSHYIPNDYIKVKSFILSNHDFSRGIWIPRSSSWTIFTIEHPQISFVDEINSDWQNLSSKINKYNSIFGGKSYINFLKQKDIHNLFNNSSIEYVFIPLKDKANDDDFFFNYGEPRQYYINELNKINWLKRINIGTKEVVVYENENYRPHIYITNNQESINKNQIFTKINYKFVNPTEYTFSVKNFSKPFYLNFSEAFNSDWNIRIGSFNWFDALKEKNYFINETNHIKNDAGLNSYFINPIEVCKVHKVNNVYKVGDGCVRNADGSYDISGTLYFKPQSYMYLGLIISGTTLVVVVGYLVLVLGGAFLKKGKYDKQKK